MEPVGRVARVKQLSDPHIGLFHWSPSSLLVITLGPHFFWSEFQRSWLIWKPTNEFRHNSSEVGTWDQFALSARGLPNKLTVGHIGQPWPLEGGKQDKFAVSKKVLINIIRGWVTHLGPCGCFLNWERCCKVFYNYFHLHPNCSHFLQWNTKTTFSSFARCRLKTICFVGILDKH